MDSDVISDSVPIHGVLTTTTCEAYACDCTLCMDGPQWVGEDFRRSSLRSLLSAGSKTSPNRSGEVPPPRVIFQNRRPSVPRFGGVGDPRRTRNAEGRIRRTRGNETQSSTPSRISSELARSSGAYMACASAGRACNLPGISARPTEGLHLYARANFPIISQSIVLRSARVSDLVVLHIS
jgi:hypothetical protein